MKSQLSAKVRLFAFGAVMSTLVGTTMAAPSLNAQRSVEMTVVSATPTQVAAVAQPTVLADHVIEAEGGSIAAPTQGSVEILQAIFDFILALLGL